MAVEVLMSKMGLTMTEGIVGEWKKLGRRWIKLLHRW